MNKKKLRNQLINDILFERGEVIFEAATEDDLPENLGFIDQNENLPDYTANLSLTPLQVKSRKHKKFFTAGLPYLSYTSNMNRWSEDGREQVSVSNPRRYLMPGKKSLKMTKPMAIYHAPSQKVYFCLVDVEKTRSKRLSRDSHRVSAKDDMINNITQYLSEFCLEDNPQDWKHCNTSSELVNLLGKRVVTLEEYEETLFNMYLDVICGGNEMIKNFLKNWDYKAEKGERTEEEFLDLLLKRNYRFQIKNYREDKAHNSIIKRVIETYNNAAQMHDQRAKALSIIQMVMIDKGLINEIDNISSILNEFAEKYSRYSILINLGRYASDATATMTNIRYGIRTILFPDSFWNVK